MHAVRPLQVSISIALFFTVNGVLLPLKKRPFIPEASVQPGTPNGVVEPLVASHTERGSHSGQSTGASPSEHSGQSKYLNPYNDEKQVEAYQKHKNLVETMKGRLYHTLTPSEVDEVNRTRKYLYNSKRAALRGQDNPHYNGISFNEVQEMLKALPTKFMVRQPPTGPMTPEVANKLKKAQFDKEFRERKQAAVFMEKEFGKPRQILRSGPRRLDVTHLDPQHAKSLTTYRKYYDQRNEVRRKKNAEKKRLAALKGNTKSATVPTESKTASASHR